MPALKNLFWDSCVFIRYLTRLPTEYLAEIDQYISEAKEESTLFIAHHWF